MNYSPTAFKQISVGCVKLKPDTPSRRSAASDGWASLFGVFHSSAAVCPIQHVETVSRPSVRGLTLMSVPENYSENYENKHVNEGRTDRKLKC